VLALWGCCQILIPRSVYIIESGVLKASKWRIGRSDRFMVESMMPATVTGAPRTVAV
jgi:hypothetical protein